MTPSLRSVRLFRFWTAAASRTAGMILLLWWLPGWVAELAGGFVTGDPLSTPRYNPNWWGLSIGLVLAFGLVYGAKRLSRFLIPMPRPECPECGYAVPDGADRCSECGLNLSKAEPARP